jgi:hypothetical protein
MDYTKYRDFQGNVWELDGVNEFQQRTAICIEGPRKGERDLFQLAPGDPETLGVPGLKRKTKRPAQTTGDPWLDELHFGRPFWERE